MKQFPRLKFCGLTREVDVEHAIEAGAAAVGFNFVPSSKRFISPKVAAHLSRVAAGRISRVGVFVNLEPYQIADIVRECELDALQLHGDETPDWLAGLIKHSELTGLSILKALPYRGVEDDPVLELWSREANDPSSPVSAILVDAYDPLERGGTGKVVRWDLLHPRPASFFATKTGQSAGHGKQSAPLILAGGIQRQNVLEACRHAKPDGIDIASGIETAPGIKDRDAMLAVAEQALCYFATRDAENC